MNDRPPKSVAAVNIDADEVHVASKVEVPPGHVVVEHPTAATPAVARPSSDVRDAEIEAESQTALRTGGQRWTNRLWELTQAIIAVSVSLATIGVCAFMIVNGRGGDGAFLLLSNVFFLVVGTYFQRTNHTKVGGPGAGRDER